MRFNRLLLALLPCALWAQIGGSFLSGDLVRGGSALTTPGRVPTVSALGTLGQSDVSLASGIFSRAGTVGLSATGANVVTVSTNGVERGRFTSDGSFLVGYNVGNSSRVRIIGATGANPPSSGTISTAHLELSGAGLANSLSIGTQGVSPFGGWIQVSSFSAYGTNYPLQLQPNGGNVLIGTTTDDGVSKLQVAGSVKVSGPDGTVATVANPSFTITATSNTNNRLVFLVDPTADVALIQSTESGVSNRPLYLNHHGGNTVLNGLGSSNVLIGTTTDDGSSKLQVSSTGDTRLRIATTGTSLSAGIIFEPTTGVPAGVSNSYIVSSWASLGMVFRLPRDVATHGFQFRNNADTLLAHLDSSTGNLILGTVTTSGGIYKLDVQSSGSSGTLRVYDQTATTGVTRSRWTPGAGQSTIPMLASTAGTALTFGVADAISLSITADGYIQGATGARFGLFGVTPVVRQTATADAASILALLQAYGLSN